MKKQTKLEKRRKTVLGAILGFGAVALISTATATWIITVNNTTYDGDLSVTVDTVENNAVNMAIAMADDDNGLNLADPKTDSMSSGDVISADGAGDFGTPDFHVTLSTVTVTFGKDYLSSDEKLSLNLSLEYDGSESHTSNQGNLVGEDGDLIKKRTDSESLGYQAYTVTSSDGTEPDRWTYVDLKTKAIDLSEVTSTTPGSGPSVSSSSNEADGTTTITYSNLTVEFTWGSFFGVDGPIKYYNTVFKDAATAGAEDSRNAITLADTTNIQKELENMNSLTGLTITVSLSKTSA